MEGRSCERLTRRVSVGEWVGVGGGGGGGGVGLRMGEECS